MSGKSAFLLFTLLDSLWKNCLLKLDRIDNRLDNIEKAIFSGKEKEMVREISVVKTDIINFWRIVEPQKNTLDSLSTEGTSFFGSNFSPYFTDLLGTYGRAWNTLSTYKETILALEDTNQSLLYTKTNEVIQFLTVVSVILLPLTLIASIWGMNVPVPFEKSFSGFWFIIGGMSTLLLFLIVYFRKKKWL